MLSGKEFKKMDAQELSIYGLHDLAYIKKEHKKKKDFYSIFAADGTQLAMANSLSEAVKLVERNDMKPMIAH